VAVAFYLETYSEALPAWGAGATVKEEKKNWNKGAALNSLSVSHHSRGDARGGGRVQGTASRRVETLQTPTHPLPLRTVSWDKSKDRSGAP